MGAERGPGIPGEAAGDEYVLPLSDLLRTILKRLWVILLVMLIVVGVAAGFSLGQTPMYEGSIELLVGQERGTAKEGLGGEIQGLQQLTQTMVQGVNSRPIAEAVIEQHDLRMTPEDFLEDYLSVEQISGTQFIEVKYRDPSPERARLVANTVGEAFSEQVSEVSPSASDVTATVWARAEVPEEPVSPNLVLNIGLALAMGLMLGVGLTFLLEYLDDSWRSPEEAEHITGVPTLGIVPEFREPTSKKARKQQDG